MHFNRIRTITEKSKRENERIYGRILFYFIFFPLLEKTKTIMKINKMEHSVAFTIKPVGYQGLLEEHVEWATDSHISIMSSWGSLH